MRFLAATEWLAYQSRTLLATQMMECTSDQIVSRKRIRAKEQDGKQERPMNAIWMFNPCSMRHLTSNHFLTTAFVSHSLPLSVLVAGA